MKGKAHNAEYSPAEDILKRKAQFRFICDFWAELDKAVEVGQLPVFAHPFLADQIDQYLS